MCSNGLNTLALPVSSFHRKTCEKTYKQYTARKRLGKGVSALVYELCDEKADQAGMKECPFVLKVDYASAPQDFFTSMVTQKVVAETLGIAPKVHDIWFCKQKDHTLGFAVMDRMDGSLVDMDLSKITKAARVQMGKQIQNMVDQLHSVGIVHNDLWEPNIFWKGNDLFLGDFGNITFSDHFTDDNHMVKDLRQRLKSGTQQRPTWIANDKRTDEQILNGVKRF